MDDELQPDLDRFVGPFRRHWMALVALFVVLAVVLSVIAGSVLSSDEHEATIEAGPATSVTSLALAGVLPDNMLSMIDPQPLTDVASYFSRDNLGSDLGLPSGVTVTSRVTTLEQVEVHLIGPSAGDTQDSVDALLEGYEADRRATMAAEADEAIAGAIGRIEVIDGELASLSDLPSDLAERSALAGERAGLLALVDMLDTYPETGSIGADLEVVDPVAEVPSSTIARLGLGITAALVATAGIGLLMGLLDRSVRTRNDLMRVAPGQDMVGLVDSAETGAVAIGRGLVARHGVAGLTGSIQVISTGVDVGDLAGAIQEVLAESGATCEVRSFDSHTEFRDALNEAANASANLVVVDWGRSSRATTRLRVTQLRFAEAAGMGLIMRGVPRRELEAAFR